MTDRFCSGCGEGLPRAGRYCGGCGQPTTGQRPAVPPRLGHYELRGVIAEGGMGVVHRAHDTRLGRDVAIKVLRPDLAADAELQARFVREARDAAALEHPGILPVFEAGVDDGVTYLVTRLVDGADLGRTVDRDGPLEPARALAIAGQVAAALDYAHGCGVMHRDVKPGNVLLVGRRGAEHAYLIDFGIAKRADHTRGMTRTGHFIGTPDFAAPEQIAGAATGPRSDQFALAALLYFCLTGRPPGRGHGEPRLADARPGLPVALSDAVARGLSVDRHDRFDSCGSFVAAARPSRSSDVTATRRRTGHGAGGPPVGRIAREPARGASSSGRMALAAAAVAVVLAVAGVGAWTSGVGRSAPGESVAAATPTPTPEPPRQRAPRPGTRATAAEVAATTTPAPVAELDVDALDLDAVTLRGYDAKLPAGWDVEALDRLESDADGVKRRRTGATDPATGVSVEIDRVTGMNDDAKANRARLQAVYAEKGDGYAYVSDADRVVAGRPTYEWRSTLPDRETGETRRRVDLLFDAGGGSFAVLASGSASFDDLGALATTVAESVTVPGPSEPPEDRPEGDARQPTAGDYRGVATQHLADGTENPGVPVSLRLGRAGTVAYDDLGCTARLTPSGYEGSARVYRERFVSGDCDDPGTWLIERVSDTELRGRWSSPADAYTLTVDLTT